MKPVNLLPTQDPKILYIEFLKDKFDLDISN